MPRNSRGPRLWLRPARARGRDGSVERAVWIVRDGRRSVSTRCGQGDRAEAEKQLAAYIAAKYRPGRRGRDLGQIPVADVISIYLSDVAPGLARPSQTAARCDQLLDFFGTMTLDNVTGASCRAYSDWRHGKGPATKGGRRGAGGARAVISKTLQQRSAITPRKGCTGASCASYYRPRARRASDGSPAMRRRACCGSAGARGRRRKASRPPSGRCDTWRAFLLLGLYTGSRPSAILAASWLPGPRRSLVDLDNGVFHRRGEGVAETTKRQPTVRLAPRLQAHLRRWRAADRKAGRAHVVMFDGAPVASVKVALGRAVELAQLPGAVTAYTLRHTCASWLVARGLPTRMIADFLGTSEPMIVAHYGHLAPDYQQEAALAIGSRAGRSSGG